MSALIWPLFDLLAWGQPATVVVDTTGEVTLLASVRSVGVESPSHFVGGHDRVSAALATLRLDVVG